MSSIFVVLYDLPRPSTTQAQKNYYWHREDGTSSTGSVVETQPHFRGKFSYRINDWDLWWQNPAQDFITSETPVNFIGKFKPTVIKNIDNWWQNEPQDSSSAYTVEENPHFISKFNQPKIRFAQSQTTDFIITVIQPETNTNFIGKYNPGRIQGKYWQNEPQDTSSTYTTEAEPHFIGKYVSLPIKGMYYWNVSDLPPVVAQSETNINFLAKFIPTVIQFFKYNSRPTDETSSVTPIPSITIGGQYTECDADEITAAYCKAMEFALKLRQGTPLSINEAAIQLGRKGGLARTENMTPKQRSQLASHAAKTRWK